MLGDAVQARKPIGGKLAVSTAALHLFATFPQHAPGGWAIAVPLGAAVVYILGEGVTTATGFPVEPGSLVSLGTSSLDGWYVIAGEATEIRALGGKANS